MPDTPQKTASAERASLSPEEKAALAAGWAALVEGRKEQALAEFEKALRISARGVEARYGSAAALKALGRAGDAAQAFEQVLEQAAAASGTIPPADQIRLNMFRHMAESALRQLKSGGA